MDHGSQHAIANALRRVRLLGVADAALFLWNVIEHRAANRRFQSTHPDFSPPPASLCFDAYGHVDHQRYMKTGADEARIIADTINRELTQDHVRVCEWGCGPGRVIRHLRHLLRHPTVDLYGTDYNAETIEWCRQHIPDVRFRTNNLSPPLPFDAGSLDCIYALSVFTHLSEQSHCDWIRELQRVLGPGGILLLTTHSNAAADRLLPGELRQYAAGELVLRGLVREGKKWYLAYQSPDFVRNRLLSGWEVVSHVPARFFRNTQDLWVARKRAA